MGIIFVEREAKFIKKSRFGLFSQISPLLFNCRGNFQNQSFGTMSYFTVD